MRHLGTDGFDLTNMTFNKPSLQIFKLQVEKTSSDIHPILFYAILNAKAWPHAHCLQEIMHLPCRFLASKAQADSSIDGVVDVGMLVLLVPHLHGITLQSRP
jgi:hypothetical protein